MQDLVLILGFIGAESIVFSFLILKTKVQENHKTMAFGTSFEVRMHYLFITFLLACKKWVARCYLERYVAKVCIFFSVQTGEQLIKSLNKGSLSNRLLCTVDEE